MPFKLGKKPARTGAIRFKFADYFDKAALPKPPMVFGHETIGRPWSMLGNDQFSDCVFAGAAHETMVWTREGTGKPSEFTTNNALSDYTAVTGFNPKDPDTDQGTDMQQAAEYRRTVGVVDAHGARHKIDAYVAIHAGRPDDLALAAYLFGACGVGVRFPDSAMDQFDEHKPWSLIKGDTANDGHYVPCVGRNSKGQFLVVTWGRLQAMDPDWYSHFCDEAVAYISLETLNAEKVTPEGFDIDALRRDLKQLST